MLNRRFLFHHPLIFGRFHTDNFFKSIIKGLSGTKAGHFGNGFQGVNIAFISGHHSFGSATRKWFTNWAKLQQP